MNTGELWLTLLCFLMEPILTFSYYVYFNELIINVDEILIKIGLKPGGIILMHDGGGDRSRTVQALSKIIEELTNRGYKFVSVPELLQIQELDSKAKPTV